MTKVIHTIILSANDISLLKVKSIPVSQIAKLDVILNKHSWEIFSHCLLLLAGGMALFSFLFNVMPACFIYFCGCRNCLSTLMITKKHKWIEKSINT